MITLARHPLVQQIVDNWQHTLDRNDNPQLCTDEDLRRLIASLEEALGRTGDELDTIGAHSFKALLNMNWKWVTQKFHSITSLHRRP